MVRRSHASGLERWNVTCGECGKHFSSKRSDAQYCSPTCRSKVFRREKKKAEMIDLARYYLGRVRQNMPTSGRSAERAALLDLKSDIERTLSTWQG